MNRIFFYNLIGIISLCFTSCTKTYPQNLFPNITPVKLEPYSLIDFPLINESSGLIKSRKNPDILWTHNDSDDQARIFAIDSNGKLIKTKTDSCYSGIYLKDAVNNDWEDIAVDDKGNLIIADSGNNKNIRKDLAVYIFSEPSIENVDTIYHYKKIPFYYPEQKQFPPDKKNRNFDGEAIFWANQKLYLLTKHRGDENTRLYYFKSLRTDIQNELVFVDEFNIHGMVTAADISDDCQKLVVLTYNAVWMFESDKPSDNFFKSKIYWLPIIADQCESICFYSEDNLIIGNEQRSLFQLSIEKLICIN